MRHVLPALILLGLAISACGAAPGGQPTPAIVAPTATFPQTDQPIPALGLEGRLIFTQGGDGLWQLNLTTGETVQLWDPPEGGRVEGVAVSPDGGSLVLTYTPPREEGAPPIVRSDLYLMQMGAAEPELFLEHRGQYEAYFDPAWSPDGEWLYFTRSDVVEGEAGSEQPVLNIERVPVNGGQPELVFENAEEISFSATGERVAYRAFDPQTYTRSLNVARADGSEPRELLSPSDFPYIASPVLSSDGATIAFSGAASSQAAWGTAEPRPLWSDRLRPVPALAHGLPADIWTIPTEGGEPLRRTSWETDAPVPAWSPNGTHLAVLRPGGLFVLRPGGPRYLTPAAGHGDLEWVP